MGSLWKKFLTVMWKNLVLKRRHWLATALEVIMPTLLFVTVAIMRNSINDPRDVNPAVVFDQPYNLWSRSERDSFSVISFCQEDGEFYLLPEDSQFVRDMASMFNDTIENVCSGLQYPERMRILTTNDIEYVISRYEEYRTEQGLQGEDDEDDDESTRSEETATILPRVYGAAIFSTSQAFTDEDLSYTMRFCYDSDDYYASDTEHLFDPYGYIDDVNDPEVEESKYYINAETAIQAILDLLFIQKKTGREDFLPISTSLQDHTITYTLADYGLTVPAHADNDVAILLGDIMPLFAALSFVFVVPPLIKRIVHEKETGVKEFMRMMGLPGWINWLCWFLSALTTILLINLIIMCTMVINFKVAPVIGYSDAGVVYIYFTLYGISLIFMMFAVSTFIDNANLALATGIIVHILSFFWPYGLIGSSPDLYEDFSLGVKLALCIFPNVGLYLGIRGLLRQEESTTGIKWDTLGEPLTPGDDLTMAMVLGMFLADAFLYGLMTWYVDQIKPGPFGQAKKWYFPFQMSYWCGGDRKSDDKYNVQNVKDFNDHDENDKMVWETEPEGKPGVQVQNLHKIFGTKLGILRKSTKTVHAVKGVRFSAFPGQIMALLGHNGAGKTTTMSILTGLYSATSGTAVINGYDINTSIESIRGSLGLCPQANMLFPSLTVMEHLRFFGMLKGLEWTEAKVASKEIAEKVILGSKKGKMSSTLSGGMKRKLHLGISIIGDSNILLLDEPTSGMDPEARREIWDLLQDFKSDRTIILTTHFMEEADALGDRIAIMASGKVKCYGTSMFLKNSYGKGYRLTMTKKPGCNSAQVKDLIRQYVPSAETLTNVSGELAMSLPKENQAGLTSLLKALSEKKSTIGIDSFGLSITTLEDVFLQVGAAEQDAEMELEEQNNNDAFDEIEVLKRQASLASNPENGVRAENFRAGYAKGTKLLLVQLKGLLKKRLLQTKRTWLIYSLMAAVPIFLAIMSDLIINLFNYIEEDNPTVPPLTMTLADYEDSFAFVDVRPTDGFVESGLGVRFNDKMTEVINMEGEALEVYDSSWYLENQVEFKGMEAYGRTYLMASELNSTTVNVDDCDPANSTCLVLEQVTQFSARFNTVPFHARPLARNLLDNGIYRTLVNTSGSITATFEPIIVEEEWLTQWEYESFVYPSVLVYGVLLAIGWMLLLATFLIFPIKERITNAKQVQIMAGVHPITYWSSYLLWDFAIFITVSAIVTVVIVFVDQRDLFSTPETGFAFFLLMFLYGFAGILLAYIFSFLTQSTPSAFALYTIVVLVAGVIAFIVWFLRLLALDVMYEEDPFSGDLIEKEAYSGPDLVFLSDILRYSLSFLPCLPHMRATFAIIQVREEHLKCENQIDREDLVELCTEMATTPSIFETDFDGTLRRIGGCCDTQYVDPSIAVCGTMVNYTNSETGFTNRVMIEDCPGTTSFYTWDAVLGINIDLLYLTFDTLLFMAILVGMDSGWIQRQTTEAKYKLGNLFKRRKSTEAEKDATPLDADVVAEQENARDSFDTKDHKSLAMVVKDMSKRFGDFRAVRGLSFTVRQGECFGFLGVNGAGKTTSFRMLTGDEYMTTGEATLYGYDRHQDKRKFMRVIGYCPQFDSIIDVLTGREMLSLFAHIRGVPSSLRKAEIDKWIDFVGLQKYASRQCGTYSGGNKRKLNVAQALVGDPPIIFLDEPSTGVDPAARRRLWQAIANIKRRGQSVVITSHSMEECEALCDRLAIMVDGQFRCIGGPQHLKNKFGQGFSVIVKLDRDRDETKGDGMDKVSAFMMEKFKGRCEIKDQHSGYIQWYISDPSIPWHGLFETMMLAQEKFDFIQDYSLGETSLEDVFLFFAQKK